MKHSKLISLNFMALCCILGLFSKKLINPFANIITEALHIPGGISTGFSIMFLVVAVEAVQSKKCGTLMATAQGLLALVLGRVGSMGILMPLSYIATGMAIDVVYGLQHHLKLTRQERMVFANALAAFMASFVANGLVFRLSGPVLWLYLGVSAVSGTCYGFLAERIVNRLEPMLQNCGWKDSKGDTVSYEVM
ncbi:MAG: hypothetical protein IJO55_11765 [Lachnospiraceae bacterium]|nr:hypothetical protein [Lachnospiraceae bacterium]